MMRRAGVAALVLVASACAESGRNFHPETKQEIVETSSEDAETESSSLGCVVSASLFTPFCVRCHNQNEDFPNLNAGALGHLVNTEAVAYPGKILVVPGDVQASLVYRKVNGPELDEGLAMPPDAAGADIPAEAKADLEAWIAAGAPACEGHNDPGPMTVAPPIPGASIAYNGLPEDFVATKPSWSEVGTCTAHQWWGFSGDHDSASMHPGQACIGCHTREREGPVYSFAGTVYAAIDEAADCRGVGGVRVEILDGEDGVIGTTTSNSAGNFYILKNKLGFEPFRARLSYQGREREMKLIQSSTGDCNTCHDSAGNQGTLGRIVAP